MSGRGKSKFKILLIGLGLFFLPFFSHAQVVINEVYYSTATKQWVEIYNNTDADIDITQYRILDDSAHASTTNGGHSISTTTPDESNMIPAHEYGVVMAKDSIVSAVRLFKASLGMKTTGDYSMVTLKKGSFTDTVQLSGGFSTNSNSLQRQSDGTWISAIPTPGLINSSTPVSTSTPEVVASTTDQTSSNNQTSQTENVSVHYSSVPLSNVIPEIAYKVGAGRSRLGSVGTPIEFRGESNADFSGFTNYKWSFGDGAIGYGHIISHSYAYPGDYVVVLNAVSPAGQAISRTDVKIISEDFVISSVSPERVEVENDSNYEVNLFGRAIESGGKDFVFPEDTIIKPGQKISFPSSVTGLHPLNDNVSMIVVGDSLNKSFVPAVQIAENKSFDQKQILDLWSKAQNIKNQLLVLGQTNVAVASVALDSLPEPIVSTSTSTGVAHRGWVQIVKDFFLGRK